VAIAPVAGEKETASKHIRDLLALCDRTGLLTKPRKAYLASLTISYDYRELSSCCLVLECVIEDIEIKKAVYKRIMDAVSDEAIMATNTSAIPISMLQQYVTNPGRFIGIHWAEPAFATRFMEITQGDNTDVHVAEWVYDLAHCWGKEPTLLKKDIRGFITNRLMYAVYRETLSLVEKGQATLEDVDKAFRYDAGSWMTLMGIFRRMDFLGLKDFLVIFETLFPELDNNDEPPAIMQRLIETKAGGIQNCHGLYDYTAEEAKRWDEAFAAFNGDIYYLAALYPSEQIPQVYNEKMPGHL
jgi:3-hydroxybutyryl-CoA dehydrogenase